MIRTLLLLLSLLFSYQALSQTVDITDSDSSIIFEDATLNRFSGSSRSFVYTFTFTPRGEAYSESLTISYDEKVFYSEISNGFTVNLNGVRIQSIPRRSGGQFSFKNHRVTISESQAIAGTNTLTIGTTSPNDYENVETLIKNISVATNSSPISDVAVSNVVVDDEVEVNSSFSVTADVGNIGAIASSANTLAVYISSSNDLSNADLVAAKTIGAIAGLSSQTEDITIKSPAAVSSIYLWACVDHEAEDIDTANNCSNAIVLEITSSASAKLIPAMQILLLDEEADPK
jgi:hypothetical protein